MFFNTFFPQLTFRAKLAMRLKTGGLQQCNPLFTLMLIVNIPFALC